MSEISMYEAQKKKMEGLCEEHDLTYRFQKDTYPPTFTISPIQGMDAQLSMLENVEEAGYISPEAKMTWIFKDGSLETKVTGGTFTITKTLRTKIESVLMKMLTYWMQYFFRDVMEKRSLKDGMMPVINEDEVEDDDTDEEDLEEPDDIENAEMLDNDEPEDTDDDLGDTADSSVATDDDLYNQAVSIVRMENKATVSLLQRRLNVGYARAARIMELLEENGVVGPFAGSNPREVLPSDEPDDSEVADDE